MWIASKGIGKWERERESERESYEKPKSEIQEEQEQIREFKQTSEIQENKGQVLKKREWNSGGKNRCWRANYLNNCQKMRWGWPSDFISRVDISTKIVGLKRWGGGFNPQPLQQFKSWKTRWVKFNRKKNRLCSTHTKFLK